MNYYNNRGEHCSCNNMHLLFCKVLGVLVYFRSTPYRVGIIDGRSVVQHVNQSDQLCPVSRNYRITIRNDQDNILLFSTLLLNELFPSRLYAGSVV